MDVRFVDGHWEHTFEQALNSTAGPLKIISPFVKEGVRRDLFSSRVSHAMVLTRFSLEDFRLGVSDLD